MNTTDALPIIQSLADGLCPVSKRPLPPESAYQQGPVVRALFVAAQALEEVDRRRQRHAQLPAKAGQPWDAPEDALLVRAFQAKKPLEEIAEIHQRTRAAIEARLVFLGKLKPPTAAAPGGRFEKKNAGPGGGFQRPGQRPFSR